jgi:putative ABC transport system substrate-binding protein
MRRREFITLLAGSAAAWPLKAHAQQGARVRRIAVLSSLATDDLETQARHAAFLQGLQEWGWTTGRNVQIDYRWGAGDLDRFRKYAAELVALEPDVILATGTPVTAALLQATRGVPIVFAAVVDPVANGFVESLARPGGNATGFTVSEYGLWAENGWSCSRRSPRTSRARRCFAIRQSPPGSASSPPSRAWRRHCEWSCDQSAWATPPRSSAPSRHSHASRTAA